MEYINKQQLLKLIINNKITRNIIFNFVKSIHRENLNKKETKLYNWNKLLEDPLLMVEYKYFKYLNDNRLEILPRPTKQQIQSIAESLVRLDRFEILKSIILQLSSIHSDIIVKEQHIDFNRILTVACEFGRYQIAVYLVNHFRLKEYIEAILRIPKSGNVRLLKWMVKRLVSKEKFIWMAPRMLEMAVKFGNFEMVVYLSKYTKAKSTSSLHYAILHNHYNVIQWLVAHGEPIWGYDIADLVRHKQFDVLQSVLARLPPSFFKKENHRYDEIVGCGDLDIVKTLHSMGVEFTSKSMYHAIKSGNLELVKWLISNVRILYLTNVMDEAARNGKFSILQWFHFNVNEGCSFKAIDYAAKIGRLDIIEWLNEKRGEGCSINAMDFAAENNHLEVVKWLNEKRSEGCSTKAMDQALIGGHLEMCEWLMENRTEGYSDMAIRVLSYFNNLTMLKWLVERKKDEVDPIHFFNVGIEMAIRNSSLDIVRYLLDLVPSERVIGKLEEISFKVVKYGSIDMVTFFFRDRCIRVEKDDIIECILLKDVKKFKILLDYYQFNDWSPMDMVSQLVVLGNVEMLSYLFCKHKELRDYSKLTLRLAMKENHYNIIAWLLEIPSPNIVYTDSKEEDQIYNNKFYFKEYIENPTKTIYQLKLKAFKNNQLII
ncbi:hypothetical protein PPL_01380 [Heterostelium album PN500]|uniref:Ankyrin repeat protein n=1 Tax=Heterostelium pallidum (strain ATCC 26659 / Pp 5 / PN500) TaxID=670386 RepID=D3AZ40_HETP5|nr:hypothetical protein PPL_01380 [Heterostelium album PN500]EFA85597.1 hypothetical protein PPL_01380 [Heterostelium album PN500]|eukprot:XP_020437704.1 hypothetical protein PPL_01380 [Heterostelium album PN500]